MPYIFRHETSGEILACIQRNSYKLDYYGVLWWEQEEEAEAAKHESLDRLGYQDDRLWQLLHIEEHRLKICNVKLKNDPRLVLTMDQEGRLQASPRTESSPNV